MKLIIRYQRDKFVSNSSTEYNADEASEEFYEKLLELDIMKFDLANGSFLVMAKEAIRRSTFEFIDDES